MGVCSGGTKPNVVPAEAEIEIDCRVKTAAEGDRIRKAINEIRTTVPGTSREVIERDSKMPMEETEANMALFEKAKICGEKVGLKFSHQFVGGSDGEQGCLLWVSRPPGPVSAQPLTGPTPQTSTS